MDVLESLLAEATALTSRSNSPFECLTADGEQSDFKAGGEVQGGLQQLLDTNGNGEARSSNHFCFKRLSPAPQLAQIIKPTKAGLFFQHLQSLVIKVVQTQIFTRPRSKLAPYTTKRMSENNQFSEAFHLHTKTRRMMEFRPILLASTWKNFKVRL